MVLKRKMNSARENLNHYEHLHCLHYEDTEAVFSQIGGEKLNHYLMLRDKYRDASKKFSNHFKKIIE